MQVPKKFNIAIAILTIRDEGATDRKCSQLFHNCLQCKISFCRGGEFRDG